MSSSQQMHAWTAMHGPALPPPASGPYSVGMPFHRTSLIRIRSSSSLPLFWSLALLLSPLPQGLLLGLPRGLKTSVMDANGGAKCTVNGVLPDVLAPGCCLRLAIDMAALLWTWPRFCCLSVSCPPLCKRSHIIFNTSIVANYNDRNGFSSFRDACSVNAKIISDDRWHTMANLLAGNLT